MARPERIARDPTICGLAGSTILGIPPPTRDELLDAEIAQLQALDPVVVEERLRKFLARLGDRENAVVLEDELEDAEWELQRL